MKKKLKELMSQMMSKTVRDLIHYSVKWVASEQGPGFRCSYSACGAQLTHPRAKCAKCHKYRLKAGPKPSEVPYYCGTECALLDWNAGHGDFHVVSSLVDRWQLVLFSSIYIYNAILTKKTIKSVFYFNYQFYWRFEIWFHSYFCLYNHDQNDFEVY